METILSKRDIESYFPIPCHRIEACGIGEGIILKFRHFYLKIYDGKESYIVKGYLYGKQGMIFKDHVPVYDFQKYAAQFTNERMFLPNFYQN